MRGGRSKIINNEDIALGLELHQLLPRYKVETYNCTGVMDPLALQLAHAAQEIWLSEVQYLTLTISVAKCH